MGILQLFTMKSNMKVDNEKPPSSLCDFIADRILPSSHNRSSIRCREMDFIYHLPMPVPIPRISNHLVILDAFR